MLASDGLSSLINECVADNYNWRVNVVIEYATVVFSVLNVGDGCAQPSPYSNYNP